MVCRKKAVLPATASERIVVPEQHRVAMRLERDTVSSTCQARVMKPFSRAFFRSPMPELNILALVFFRSGQSMSRIFSARNVHVG